MWWQPHKFEAKRPYLEARGRVLRSVRAYFDAESFQEVETPILQVCPVMDTHIHGFKTEILKPDLTHERDMYLHTSPEFAMKKLMVAGLPRIYQLCHVFRNGEGSRLHSPEFTMLEWYRAEAGYRDIMDDCVKLLRQVAQDLGITHYRYRDLSADPFGEWEIISVAAAFRKYAGIDLNECLPDPNRPRVCLPPRDDGSDLDDNSTWRFAEIVKAKGIRVAEGDRWDDLFFRVMAEKIEPHLGVSVPCILYDYPVSMASLARRKPEDGRFAERFEMYVCGVELCNAFGELIDPTEQRNRFKSEINLKEKLYGYRYPVDEDFLKALEYGLPESGGNALGFDRLVMLATGAEDIDQVLWTGKPSPETKVVTPAKAGVWQTGHHLAFSDPCRIPAFAGMTSSRASLALAINRSRIDFINRLLQCRVKFRVALLCAQIVAKRAGETSDDAFVLRQALARFV